VNASNLEPNWKVGIVDIQQMFDGNPCRRMNIPSDPADTTHSGVLTIAGDNTLIIPQSTLLDYTKTYTICYAEGAGDDADNTWRDSYIRFGISMVEFVTVTFSDEAANTNTITFTTGGHMAR